MYTAYAKEMVAVGAALGPPPSQATLAVTPVAAERCHRVRVWFGRHVIASPIAELVVAVAYEQAMRRRFPGVRITNEEGYTLTRVLVEWIDGQASEAFDYLVDQMGEIGARALVIPGPIVLACAPCR